MMPGGLGLFFWGGHLSWISDLSSPSYPLSKKSFHMRANHLAIQSGEEIVKKTIHDQSPCIVHRNSSSGHVEKLVGADGAVGGSMTAANFVVKNFQAGHGVRVGVVAEDEVFDLLVGIGACSAGLDLDEAGKNGA